MKQKFCALFFLIGTTLAATAQQGGYSLKFDGTNDYVTCKRKTDTHPKRQELKLMLTP